MDEIDIMITEDGDFILCEDENEAHTVCEMLSCKESDYLAQIIMNRVKTMKPDWFYDHVGADLEQLLGEDNTEDTANKGIELINNALCGDGFLEEENVWIKPSPVDIYTIVYLLAVRVSDLEQLMFKINIALSSGVNIEEV